LLAQWTQILGPFPRRCDLRIRELARETLPDHTRLRIRYRVDPETEVEAYLLLPPSRPEPRPAMVVLHPTTNDTIEESAGVLGRETRQIGLQLVRRGYVCIVPKNFLWSGPEGESYQGVTESLLHRPKQPWRTGMARMVWDAIRATDVLCERPEVDRKRIGTIGHSLGGKEALYHAAFDPRIRAAVSCEGGVGLSFSNWDADWYLGRQIRDPGFHHDNHEVLALAAPTPLLIIGGESADGARSWPYLEAVLPVWRLFGAEERLGLLRHGLGHEFAPAGPVRDRIYHWLGHWLADR
jgi:dienelactone hydrolase